MFETQLRKIVQSGQLFTNINDAIDNLTITNPGIDHIDSLNPNIDRAKLYAENLIKKIKLNNENFSIKVLGIDQVNDILELRSEMFGLINNEDIYRQEENEKEIIGYYCSSEGITIGIYHIETLIAYGILALPIKESAGNFARLRKFRITDRFNCARLASCMVKANWQGHGLHHILLNLRLAIAKELNKSLVWAVLSLKNPVSRHNLFQSNFKLIWIGLIGGLWRQIMANVNLSTFHFDYRIPKNSGYNENANSTYIKQENGDELNNALLVPVNLVDKQLQLLHSEYIGCKQYYLNGVENILFKPF